MTAVVEYPTAFDEPRVRSSSWKIVYAMLPSGDEDPELKEYFQKRFARIIGGKKRACKEFLQYVATCGAYDREASELAKEVLANEFWSNSS